MNNNLLNVRNNKLNSMNNNALKAALDRDISFAILKSPSLNGLNNIENTDLERPFLEMNNLMLDYKNNILGNNNNELVENVRNNSLNPSTVAQVVSLNMTNGKGTVSNTVINKNGNNNLEVRENSVDLEKVGENKIQIKKNAPIIKVITNFDYDNLYAMEQNLMKQIDHDSLLKIEDDKPYLENNVMESGNTNNIKEKLNNTFRDIMGNMKVNKLLSFIFLIIVGVVIYILRR